ncbi:MAG: hypothetical protein CL946_01440 [Ectothiorhodospiraceae bacterium]|nr:hypothetical protein [Ectothiorhodospiraceae bacterium]
MRAREIITTIVLVLVFGTQVQAQFEYWEQTDGPSNLRVGSLLVLPEGVIVAGTNNGIYASSNEGDSWSAIGLLNNNIVALAYNTSKHLFAASASKGIYRSTNAGLNWTQIYDGTVRSVAISVRGDVFAGTPSGLLRSFDNGNTWHDVPLPLQSGVNSIHVSINGEIYVGTAGLGVYRSDDQGNSWINMNLPNIDVQAISTGGNLVFAGSRFSGLYRTTRGGTTWTEVNTGLESRDILAIVINSTGYVIVGTGQEGAYRSLNNGNSWQSFNSGLQSNVVSALAISGEGVVFAGTDRKRVHRTDKSIVGISDVSNTAENFGIQSVYPNPISSIATIEVQSQDDATLEIVNTLGRKVYEQKIGSGSGSVQWSGLNMSGVPVPTGLYHARLIANGTVSPAAMISVLR